MRIFILAVMLWWCVGCDRSGSSESDISSGNTRIVEISQVIQGSLKSKCAETALPKNIKLLYYNKEQAWDGSESEQVIFWSEKEWLFDKPGKFDVDKSTSELIDYLNRLIVAGGFANMQIDSKKDICFNLECITSASGAQITIIEYATDKGFYYKIELLRNK